MEVKQKSDMMERYINLITQIDGVLTQLKDRTKIAFSKENQQKLTSEDGISLLDVKNELILDYITNLAFFTLLKLRGESVKDHPCLLKLIETRTYLEKLKPVELKLKYQIDKLVRAFTLGGTQETEEISIANDPLKFKPNPENLVTKEEEQEEEETESKVYKAPKIAPVPFDDRPISSRAERDQNRLKEKAARSRLIQDLAADFDDRPEEQKNIGSYREDDLDPELADRNRYEEENFVRLQTSKKQERKIKQLQQGLIQNELLNLDDFRGVTSLQNFDQQNGSNSLLKRIRSKRLNEEENEQNNVKEGKIRKGMVKADHATEKLFNSMSMDPNQGGRLSGNFKKAKKAFKKKSKKH